MSGMSGNGNVDTFISEFAEPDSMEALNMALFDEADPETETETEAEAEAEEDDGNYGDAESMKLPVPEPVINVNDVTAIIQYLGEYAYNQYLYGYKWTEIAEERNKHYGLPVKKYGRELVGVALSKSAQTWAAANNKAWPPREGEALTELDKHVFTLYRETQSFAKVSLAVDRSVSWCRKSAQRYAESINEVLIRDSVGPVETTDDKQGKGAKLSQPKQEKLKEAYTIIKSGDRTLNDMFSLLGYKDVSTFAHVLYKIADERKDDELKAMCVSHFKRDSTHSKSLAAYKRHQEGVPWKDIAKEFGYGSITAATIACRRWFADDDKQLKPEVLLDFCASIDAGKTNYQRFADKQGVSKDRLVVQVALCAERNGFDAPALDEVRELRSKAKVMLDQGMADEEVAKHLGYVSVNELKQGQGLTVSLDDEVEVEVEVEVDAEEGEE